MPHKSGYGARPPTNLLVEPADRPSIKRVNGTLPAESASKKPAKKRTNVLLGARG